MLVCELPDARSDLEADTAERPRLLQHRFPDEKLRLGPHVGDVSRVVPSVLVRYDRFAQHLFSYIRPQLWHAPRNNALHAFRNLRVDSWHVEPKPQNGPHSGLAFSIVSRSGQAELQPIVRRFEAGERQKRTSFILPFGPRSRSS